MAVVVPRERPLLAVLLRPADEPGQPAEPPGSAAVALAEPHQLRAQLTALGCSTAGPVTLDELPSLLGDQRARPTVVLDGRVVAHDHALRMLVRDDRDDMTVLNDTVSGSAVGLRLSSRVTGRLTALPPGVRLDQLATSISRHGELTSRRLALGGLVAAVPDDADAALAIAAAIGAAQAAGGEDALRLAQSTKRLDNPIAAHLVGPWARHLGRWLVGHRVSPDAVTSVSLVLALAASALACLGTRTGYVLASVAILVSFALDCTDGQMARYAVRFSTVGSWLDGFGDRVKEQLFLAGLAIGGIRAGAAAVTGGEAGHEHPATLWWFAALAGGITLIRHFVGFGYTHALGLPNAPPVPEGQLTAQARLRFDLRKIAMLPFGERTLLLCVLVVTGGPRLGFLGVAAAGALATLAMVVGRLRRTSRRPRPEPDDDATTAVRVLSDVGVLGRLVPRWTGLAFTSVPGAVLLAGFPVAVILGSVVAGIVWDRPAGDWLTAVLLVVAALWWAVLGAPLASRPHGWLTWAIPAATATAELAVVLTSTAAVRDRVPSATVFGAATFLLTALVSLHRYDREYALGLAGGGTGRWSSIALGHEGRLLVVAVLAALGLIVVPRIPSVGIWILGCGVGMAVIGASAAELIAAVRVHRARS